MSDTQQRRNPVFKSLHKPLTYMGIERKLFFFICVGATGCFNLFDSLLAGAIVFLGGSIFGYWVTNEDPAFLHILMKSGNSKTHYDAAKQQLPKVEIH